MALDSYGRRGLQKNFGEGAIQLWLYKSYGPVWLWPYIVMALCSYGPVQGLHRLGQNGAYDDGALSAASLETGPDRPLRRFAVGVLRDLVKKKGMDPRSGLDGMVGGSAAMAVPPLATTTSDLFFFSYGLI